MNKLLVVIFVGSVIALVVLSFVLENSAPENAEKTSKDQANMYEGWETSAVKK